MKNFFFLFLMSFLSYASYGIAPITGSVYYCPGTSGTFADATIGGTWSSSNIAVGTIAPATGVFSAIASGSAIISYTVGGSSVTTTVTVLSGPGAISGPSTYCSGGTGTLTNPVSGGFWTSSITSVATISSSGGVVAAVAAGTSLISYHAGSCLTTYPITVIPAPSAISGPSSVCEGSSISLTDATGGGVWTSEFSYIAAVGSTTGIVTGVSAGFDTIYYTLSGAGCQVYLAVQVVSTPSVFAVSGGGAYCSGGSGSVINLSGSTSGIKYYVNVGGVAVDSTVSAGGPLSFGPFTGAGVYTITALNTTTGCSANMSGSASISVDPLPNIYTVSGGGSYCAGGSGVTVSTTGSDLGITYKLYTGGTLVSSLAGSGGALSFSSITAAGSYYVVAVNAITGCTDTMTGTASVVVTPTVTPTVAITATPGDTVCAGTTVTFTETSTNGGMTPTFLWTVNGTTVGTGATTYSYTPSNGDVVKVAMTSSATCPSPATVTSNIITMDVLSGVTVAATATLASCGSGVTLSASGASSYSWEPSSGLSCPTCASTSATLSGTTTYTVTGATGTCSGMDTVTVHGNRIYGTVSFSGTTPDTLDMLVWLIQFNPLDSSINALDSTLTCLSGGSPYYEFDNEAAGSYLVKGKLLHGNPPGVSGYLPTYGSSSAFWYSASSITHGTGSDNMNIGMIYGTVPYGPGFISGYVYSGAGRGTSTVVPAVGMLVYLRDAGTNRILTATYTDNTGAYSFSNIANGSYIVYPENFDDYTTPSAINTLSSSAETIAAVNFMQYTRSRIIVPMTPNVVKNVPAGNGISVYPNPASGTVTLQWNNLQAGAATATLTDVLGREVMHSAINMAAASGNAQLSLEGVAPGVYILSIQSNDFTYKTKLQVMQ